MLRAADFLVAIGGGVWYMWCRTGCYCEPGGAAGAVDSGKGAT